MRGQKGQGALEYLLLIGGAVLVAAIVIVLLLGINSQSNAQTAQMTTNVFCQQKAVTFNTQAPECTKVKAAPGLQNEYWDATQSKCVTCSGTYPSCAGTANTTGHTTPDTCGT